ncbi:spore cortex-lytic enzyme [Halalkalibacter alkalisediminis]|uniref:Spore cortex-lytic enzyme n=1 Tax=Halalkalibacter alkalisediminis TaxID=935616 RepID=A0ABV6NGG3_9BACI|nr:spore cortex-lytic enzyme [Halalkalibacter alkalisediminis]
MKRNLFSFKIPLIMAFICIGLISQASPTHAFTDQIIQRGATGDDVVELQARLQYNGFYDGTIDGVYGWSTYWAVRNFQSEFGLEIDGLVGPKMKDMLERATKYNEEFVKKALNEGRKFTHYGGTPKEIQKGPKGSNDGQAQGTAQRQEQPQPGAPQQQPQAGEQPGAGETPQQPQEQPEPAPEEQEQPEPTPGEPVPYEETPEEADNDVNIQKATNVPPGYSENDIQLMAQAVYGEARGEPYVGQVAVAAVIINRINSPTFPNTVSGVIFEPRAFTAVADGQIYMTPNETARRAVLDAINGQDPTGNAIYYFNPDTATSGWIWSRPQIKRIGKHIFCH